MWKKLLAITILAALVIGFWSGPVLAQGKGKGGGRPGTEGTPARFYFPAPPQPYPLVTGDGEPGETTYTTDEPGETQGVEAIIMGSQNPALSMEGGLGQSTIVVRLDPDSETDCEAPDSFEIQGNGTVGVGAGIRLWFNGIWEQVYEGNKGVGWLGLTEGGPSQYGHLVIRFQTWEDDLGVVTWYLNFGGNYGGNSPGSERVVVQRLADTTEGYPVWQITGFSDENGLWLSKAKVSKSYEVPMNKKKTATVSEDLGLCKAHIDFDIVQLAVPGS